MPTCGLSRFSQVLTAAVALSSATSAVAQTPKPRVPKSAAPAPKSRPAAPAKPVAPQPEPLAAAAPAPPPAPPRPTAVRVRSRYTANAQVSENTAYFGAGRQRFEYPHLVLLSQCDTGRTIQVNNAARTHLIVRQDATPSTAPVPVGTTGQTPAPKKGGIVNVTVTTTDSGERKTMLGREARHITIVTERRPDANACDQEAERITIDGWFVEMPESAAVCPAPPAPAAAAEAPCTDRIETRTVGNIVPGFAVSTTATTVRGAVADLEGGGKKKDKSEPADTSVTTIEVVDLQSTTVEPGFFDIPEGSREVQTVAELLGSTGTQPAAVSDALADALLGSVADGTRVVAPKAAGVIRVGVAPLANTSGRDVASSSLSYNLMSTLNKAPYEAVPLNGSTPSDLERDAREKSCDYILTSTLTELRSSKPGKAGGLLKKVSGDLTPASENQDARVDYQLFAIGTSQKPLASGSAKASSGGGFGIGSALRVASFAGQLYMGAMTGMTGMGRLSSLGNLGLASGFGNMGLAGVMMGPGMGVAMNAMGQPGMPVLDQNSAAVERTAGDAFRKAGGDIIDELRKKNR